MEEAELVARYPFLSASRAYLKNSSFSESELEAVSERVEATLHSAPRSPDFSAEQAVREYALERLLVYALNDSAALKRFARNKARAYARLLEHEKQQDYLAVVREFYPSVRKDGGYYSVSVLDYARDGRGLVRQDAENGRVRLEEHGLRNAFKHSLEKRITSYSGKVQKVPDSVARVAGELKPAAARLVRPANRFKGSLYSLPCIQRLRQGVGEGKRYYAAMAIAIALCADGVPKERALDELKDYAERCDKGNDAFTSREAKGVIDWVYKHEGVRLSCRTLSDHGLAGEAECAGCPRRRWKR